MKLMIASDIHGSADVYKRQVWKGIQRVEYGCPSNDAKTLEINSVKEDIQTIPDSKEITPSK